MDNSEDPSLPVAGSLRQVVGALVFGADHDLAPDEIRKCLQEVAKLENAPDEAKLYAQSSTADIRDALIDLRKDIARLELGFELSEVGGAWRLQTSAGAGRWVRNLLRQDRPGRLSHPALETLSIIAYRQPIAKSEMEGIRGVAVDHILKALMEMHLVRIVGRSDLPGHPFLYGTTASFLDHFGLKNLNELNDMDPTLQRSKPKERNAIHRKPKPAPEKPADEKPAPGKTEGQPATQPAGTPATTAPADAATDPVADSAAAPAPETAGSVSESPAPEASEGAVALREVLGPEEDPPNAEPIFEP